MTGTVTLDGTMGEGGGQVLRTALALSLVTGTPVRIWNVRGGRDKPGLLRQHLTAVQAAAQVGDAKVTGAALGSTDLTFIPRGLQGGERTFVIGSAGSTTLVLQTILPALLRAPAASRVSIEGGTHNRSAPPFDFLARTFLPVLARMGARVHLTLGRHGFEPKGGGRITAGITPGPLAPLVLDARGDERRVSARALLAGLGRHVGERELRVLAKKLGWDADHLHLEELPDGHGPGNVLLIESECAHVTGVFTGFGRLGVRAEQVATEAMRDYEAWRDADVPVDECLADQLLLPLALAGGGAFRTLPLTTHATTNMAVIREFLPVAFDVTEEHAGTVRVAVRADGSARSPST